MKKIIPILLCILLTLSSCGSQSSGSSSSDYYDLLRPVSGSTCFSAVGYDEDSEVLVVDFKESGVYVYHDVPEYEYQDMMDSSSLGGYYNRNIKGKYPSERLE